MKGLTALEIVFLLFIMIVVTLVIIRLIQTYITVGPVIQPIEDWQAVYQYQQERMKCKNICDSYVTESCSRFQAVSFCTQKVELDINGNRQTGEPGVGNLVLGVPYCEDGLYCFHIYECKCGGETLDARTCLRILCNYYNSSQVGYTKEDAIKVIRNRINPGTCSYVDEATGHNESYWWIRAGYAEGCP